jgi:hypothetical protein
MQNKILVILGIVLIILAAYFGLRNTTIENEESGQIIEEVVSTEKQYLLENEGLSFVYREGVDGYVLEEVDISNSENPYLMRMLTLTPTVDYENQKDRVNSEGSPNWHLVVFENHLKRSPSVWVDENPIESNIQLIVGERKEDVVAGANAVSYITDGLYRNKVVVIAHGGLMFVITVSYLDESSLTYMDFDEWLNSFAFVEVESNQAPTGKIDPRVACESALAYTTFETGAEAEAFVLECIEGKHPEVIDRYIEGMNLEGANI